MTEKFLNIAKLICAESSRFGSDFENDLKIFEHYRVYSRSLLPLRTPPASGEPGWYPSGYL